MDVAITGMGAVRGDGPGEIQGFDGRRELPNRKHLKLMHRGVRLGVAGVGRALASRPGWETVVPERRGLYVGSTPHASSGADLLPAIVRSQEGGRFRQAAFGEEGTQYVPPLWLVKGLSNNVLGFASAYWDLRGVNGNRCDGRVGGLAAILDAARAIDEGRADLVVAGGADSLLHAARWMDEPVGEGAAFVVLERVPAEDGRPRITGGAIAREWPAVDGGRELGELGAAAGPMELVRRLEVGERGFSVHVADAMGVGVRLDIA